MKVRIVCLLLFAMPVLCWPVLAAGLDRAPVISVQVVDMNRRPIQDAVVSIRDISRRGQNAPTFERRTGADGKAVFSGNDFARFNQGLSGLAGKGRTMYFVHKGHLVGGYLEYTVEVIASKPGFETRTDKITEFSYYQPSKSRTIYLSRDAPARPAPARRDTQAPARAVATVAAAGTADTSTGSGASDRAGGTEQPTCPKCAQPVPADAKFCPECGAKLAATCPACNKDIPPSAKFCPYCGKKTPAQVEREEAERRRAEEARAGAVAEAQRRAEQAERQRRQEEARRAEEARAAAEAKRRAAELEAKRAARRSDIKRALDENSFKAAEALVDDLRASDRGFWLEMQKLFDAGLRAAKRAEIPDSLRVRYNCLTRGFHRFGGHETYISALALTPDGKRLCTGSEDGTLIMWDAGSGKMLAMLAEHKGTVSSIAFSPDGRWCASADREGLVIVMPFFRGKGDRRFDLGCIVTSVAFSPDGKYVAIGDCKNRLTLCDVDAEKRVQTVEFRQDPRLDVNAVAFSPDGKYITVASENTVFILDAATRKTVRSLRHRARRVSALAFTSDGSKLLTGTARPAFVQLWSIPDCRRLKVFDLGSDDDPKGYGEVQSIAVAPGDGSFAVGNRRGAVIQVWDMSGTRVFEKKRGGNSYLPALVAFGKSPESVHVARDRNALSLIDWKTGETKLAFGDPEFYGTAHTGYFAPGGGQVVTTGYGVEGYYTVWCRIWRADTGTPGVLGGEPPKRLTRLAPPPVGPRKKPTTSRMPSALSPDGRYAAVSGGDIPGRESRGFFFPVLVDAQSNKVVHVFSRFYIFRGSPPDIDYSPCGRYVLVNWSLYPVPPEFWP